MRTCLTALTLLIALASAEEEAIEPDFAAADMLVTIDAAAERFLAVVQMQGVDRVGGQQIADLFHHLGKAIAGFGDATRNPHTGRQRNKVN